MKKIPVVSAKVVFKYILEKKILIYLILINAFIAISFIAIDGYYSNYLINSGIKESYTGIIMFIQQIIGAILTLFFIKKIKPNQKFKYIMHLPIIMMILLFSSFCLKVNLVSILIYFIAQCIFILIIPLIFEYEHKNTVSDYRATVDSYFSISLAIAAIISNITFGYYSDIYGFKKVFIFLIICSFILLIINNLLIGFKLNKKKSDSDSIIKDFEN